MQLVSTFSLTSIHRFDFFSLLSPHFSVFPQIFSTHMNCWLYLHLLIVCEWILIACYEHFLFKFVQHNWSSKLSQNSDLQDKNAFDYFEFSYFCITLLSMLLHVLKLRKILIRIGLWGQFVVYIISAVLSIYCVVFPAVAIPPSPRGIDPESWVKVSFLLLLSCAPLQASRCFILPSWWTWRNCSHGLERGEVIYGLVVRVLIFAFRPILFRLFCS